MRVLSFLIVFCCCAQVTIGQEDSIEDQFGWLKNLVDSIEHRSNLCTVCQSPPIIKKYFAPSGERRFQLFISCDVTNSLTRYYDESGVIVGTCKQDAQSSSCDDFGETVSFTFGRDISVLWACDVGYNCNDIEEFDLFEPYEVDILGDPCGAPIRNVAVSRQFDDYEWILPDGAIENGKQIIADQSGQYIVVVTNKSGCLDTSSFQIDLAKELDPVISGSRFICDDTGTELSMTGYVSYIWSNGDVDSSTTIYKGGSITVSAFNELGCEDIATIDVEDYSDRDVVITSDTEEIYHGQSINLTADFPNVDNEEIENITWSVNSEVGGSQTSNFALIIEDTSLVEVSIMLEVGCTFQAEIDITPLPVAADFYVPNVFNPNSVVGNDRFYVQGIPGTILIRNLSIYNRYGMPVYSEDRLELNDKDRAWNGRINSEPAPEGLYIYHAELQFANGQSQFVNGTLSLIY